MNDPVDHIMTVMGAAFDPTHGEAWNRRQVSDALVSPNTHYLLAGPGGDAPMASEPVIGFALSRGVAGEEELLLIAIDPRYRGKGAGRRLLERFIAAAEQRGMDRQFLEMRDGNPAVHLYRATGFVAVGRRPGYYRAAKDGPLDAITFLRQ